ncbi:MAG: electron transport complex subunit RsxB [Herbaspirillum sp.]
MPLLPPSSPLASAQLVERIDTALPQTQCTKCGYPSCHNYAEAIANGSASYNQCPPGGQAGVERLATLLGQPQLSLNPANGNERPRSVALIDEDICIGCTLCIQACPVDAIVGAAKQMHTVLPELCTGCDLCVPACPVDCIAMLEVTPGKTGWDAWSSTQADDARTRFSAREQRLQLEEQETQQRLAAQAVARRAQAGAKSSSGKTSIVEAAIARARLRQEQIAATPSTEPGKSA